MPGPRIRSDIVDVYVFRRKSMPGGITVEYLQLRRTGSYQAGRWHPVMGHIEPGETAVRTALRELAEETGYSPDRGLIGFWQIEPVNTFYLAQYDCIIMSPGFAVEVAADSEPILDSSHDAARWVGSDEVRRLFLWPGQRNAVGYIQSDIVPALLKCEDAAAVEPMLRIDPVNPPEPRQDPDSHL